MASCEDLKIHLQPTVTAKDKQTSAMSKHVSVKDKEVIPGKKTEVTSSPTPNSDTLQHNPLFIQKQKTLPITS